MAGELKSLKQQRTTNKGAFTRVETSLLKLESDDNATIEGYQYRLDRVKELFAEFNNIQFGIEALLSENEIEAESQVREHIEEKFYTISAKCKLAMRAKMNEVTTSTTVDSAATLEALVQSQSQMTAIMQSLTNNCVSTSTPISDGHISETHPKIQLPTIQIPTFGGDYKDWQSFFDLFQSLVHNNNSLSSSQIFQYLKSCLKDEASSVVKHFSISDANYEEAYTLLQSKYDKQDFIIESHLQALMECPCVKYSSGEVLRQLTNSFEESVRALKALDLPVDSWDCWLIFVLVSKLDKETEQLWRRKSAELKRPSLTVLLAFLDSRIYELLTLSKTDKKDLKTPNSKQPPPHSRVRFTHAVYVNSCGMCKENHQLYYCSKFKKLNSRERYKVVSKLGLCYNCLKGRHIVQECKTLSTCKQCNKHHHSLLHFESFPSKDEATEKVLEAQSLSMTKCIHENVCILPTAVVMIKDGSNQFQPFRALLDSGSQVTLISEACAQRLNLKRYNARILMSGVGGANAGNMSTKEN